MLDSRTRRLRRALDFLSAFQAHRLIGPLTRGTGIVFTLHHVRPFDGRAFTPNKLLEVTPDFLEEVLELLSDEGYDFVTLDEAVGRLTRGDRRRFASFTFDDGYRDVRDHALPVMKRHGAPLTLFITTSFADGTGDLWWLALEQALERSLSIEIGGREVDVSTPERKYAAWNRLYWQLRAKGEVEMRAAIEELARKAGVGTGSIARMLCMNWNELRQIARDPLVTIGNHTVSHLMLAKHPEGIVRAELLETQARLTRELGITPRHLAFPVGDPASAGPREFAIAREMGFASAWTTRLGVLFPEHRDHLTALPRVSLNGFYQDRKYAELFVSGVPFALNNRFRKLNVA